MGREVHELGDVEGQPPSLQREPQLQVGGDVRRGCVRHVVHADDAVRVRPPLSALLLARDFLFTLGARLPLDVFQAIVVGDRHTDVDQRVAHLQLALE
eukprot:14962900-Heterocapsa_arctica.AAC.1